MTGYVLCTAPRSGSTLLCELLKATGVAGAPASLFHRPDVAIWGRSLGVAPHPDRTEFARRVFVKARDIGRGGTGVFGLRLQRHSVPFLSGVLADVCPDAPGDFARLERMFGPLKCLYLRRDDKVRQACSLVRAEQTGLWHRAADGSELERTAPPAAPRFDAEAINTYISVSKGYDADWQTWFDANKVDPLRLTYEALAADPIGTLCDVLRFLGLPPAHARGVDIPTQKLADAVSEDWVRRYRRLGPAL